MSGAKSYLRLSGPYVSTFGLSWRVDDNVVERNLPWLRTVWAVAEEIAEFLEGFAGQRRIIHFEHVLHLIQLLRQAPPAGCAFPGRTRLWRLFAKHGNSRRHAGAFCAQLCRDVPEAVEADAVAVICQRLRRRDIMIHQFLMHEFDETADGSTSWAPWEHHFFEARVIEAFDRFTDDAIVSWLVHGRGPVNDAGEALAREISVAEVLPDSLLDRLAKMMQRPRIRGAGVFVEQLTGALALPPRRLTYQDLPLGGFADVTTRGKIEDVLPSQFALDEIDFFRRYAEHELLFFRREDPNTQVRRELIVLLDQGVRTWGSIRLVLTAAVVALARQAARHRADFLLATTGRQEPFDPLQLSAEELGLLLEATDLHRNPSAALTSLVDRPSDGPRDIVVLTHPRSLREDEIRDAANRTRGETRLFALSLDRLGQAELSELRHGVPVPVRPFHVDFSQAREVEPQEDVAPQPNLSTWTGDVEPIGFPFRFGVHGQIPARGFDFDGEEKHLLTICKHGLLHLWDQGGALVEILPRPMHKDKLVSHTVEILGVLDGFAVLSQVDGQWVASHYHLGRRHCRLHVLRSAGRQVRLEYSPIFHCLLGVDEDGTGSCIDLATTSQYASNVAGGTDRTQLAWEAWRAGTVPQRHPHIYSHQRSGNRHHLTVSNLSGEVRLWPAKPPGNNKYLPLANGRPMFLDHSLHSAQLGDNTLALRAIGPTGKNELLLYRLEGTPIRTKGIGPQHLGFRLSSGGQMLAIQNDVGSLRVETVTGSSSHRIMVGMFAQSIRFYLGHNEFFILAGKRRHFHHVTWTGGKLLHKCDLAGTQSQRKPRGFAEAVHDEAMSRNMIEGSRMNVAIYDAERWTHWARKDNLWAAGDRYGHVAVFDAQLVLRCMFMVFRNRLAGWLPDGTCFGPSNMTGKPASVDAMPRFGAVLARTAPTLVTRSSP